MKEKLKKGTFSGVIPMMGLFAMAAMMGFQSLPISQAISQEMTDSYTDLSRLTKTKSFANLYFYNYVPTGTEHSLNHKSYELGKNEGGIAWSSSEFDPETEIEDSIRSNMNALIKGQLQSATKEYLNNNYGETPENTECGVPDITYVSKIFPNEDDMKETADKYPTKMLLKVQSEVELETGGFFGLPTGVDAAPITADCAHRQGDTKYVGDATDSGGSSSGTTGGSFYFPGLAFSSVGYTNDLNASANRYHILSRETSDFYKRLYQRWLGVSAVTRRNNNVCTPSHSDWENLESRTVNAVNNDVTTPFNNLQSRAEDVDGVSGEFELETYFLDFKYQDEPYEKKYDGEISYSTADHDQCCTKTCTGPNGNSYCCQHGPEKDLIATVTPKKSVAISNITDNKYEVITEDGWNNLRFFVDYPHDFENDDN